MRLFINLSEETGKRKLERVNFLFSSTSKPLMAGSFVENVAMTERMMM